MPKVNGGSPRAYNPIIARYQFGVDLGSLQRKVHMRPVEKKCLRVYIAIIGIVYPGIGVY